MEPTSRPRIKICCIADRDEARMAMHAGADALGLVSTMPSGPGVIDESTIADVAAATPPGIDSFLLTSRIDTESIVEQARRCRPSVLQLVDAVAPTVHRALRSALPGVRLVQVIHVVGPDSVAEAEHSARTVDAILLDSGNPAAAVKELGGTGRVHDWTLSRTIRERLGKPIFLAGGLRPENVGEAIRAVRPFGVDLCSGVRTDGRLDPVKLDRFVASVRAVASSDMARSSAGRS
ncbi:MAG: phosphoribosylanthranilate isomerase [Acidobacteriota bacterium]